MRTARCEAKRRTDQEMVLGKCFDVVCVGSKELASAGRSLLGLANAAIAQSQLGSLRGSACSCSIWFGTSKKTWAGRGWESTERMVGRKKESDRRGREERKKKSDDGECLTRPGRAPTLKHNATKLRKK